MVILTPSQSHSGGVIVKPYTGNIAQELQFLIENTGKKKLRFLDWEPWQPIKKSDAN